MKDVKRRLENFSLFDRAGIERHLAKMAKKGWMLDKIGFLWTYRRIEPKEMAFSVCYFPQATAFDPGPSEEQQTFYDFCEHTGWTLAAAYAQLQVFYNERENPVPIDTDPVTEVDAVHRVAKKDFLWARVIGLVLLLLYGLLMFGILGRDPIRTLANGGLLWAGAGLLGIFVLFGWLLIFSIWLLGEYIRRKRHFRQIEWILEEADQKYLLGELMPESFRLEDRLYRDMIRKSNKSVIERIHTLEDAGKDYREYIESWVHEIKAPIATICLLCEKQKDDTGRRILMENQRIETQVDMALFYARSDQVYQDYLIKETTLQDTAEDVIRKNKYYLIQNRMQAEVSCTHTVYTDVKWIAFILNQLILNAVKYRQDSEPRIWISTKKESHSVLLTVEDNGLGIRPEELPRVFDKGFTGTNGRTRGQSTGMGLYLCRKLCVKLGIQIRAESEEGRGTRISLEFPVSNYLSKL